MTHRRVLVLLPLALAAACNDDPANTTEAPASESVDQPAVRSNVTVQPPVLQLGPAIQRDAVRHRSRAVTAKDFEPVVTQPPGVQVQRAEVAPAEEPAEDSDSDSNGN